MPSRVVRTMQHHQRLCLALNICEHLFLKTIARSLNSCHSDLERSIFTYSSGQYKSLASSAEFDFRGKITAQKNWLLSTKANAKIPESSRISLVLRRKCSIWTNQFSISTTIDKWRVYCFETHLLPQPPTYSIPYWIRLRRYTSNIVNVPGAKYIVAGSAYGTRNGLNRAVTRTHFAEELKSSSRYCITLL